MLSKLLTMLGFAQKSGNLYSGENTVELYLPKKKISLVLIATDASENTKNKFTEMCLKYNIPCITLSDKEVLSHAIGKDNRAVFGVANKKFSREVKRLYDEIKKDGNEIKDD